MHAENIRRDEDIEDELSEDEKYNNVKLGGEGSRLKDTRKASAFFDSHTQKSIRGLHKRASNSSERATAKTVKRVKGIIIEKGGSVAHVHF